MFLFSVRCQDHIDYSIRKHETLTTTPPIHVYIYRINNRLVFNLKDGYNLELQMPETMKLLSSANTLIDKSKNGENVPNHEMAEAFLFTFMPNKSYALLLNFEPRSIVFLKTFNVESDEIIITFTDQNDRPLEIKEKVNLTFLINKYKWHDIL